MQFVAFGFAVCCVLWSLPSSRGLRIQVVDAVDKKVEKELSDGNAFFQERSYLVPTKRKDAIIGTLVYPNPRNACSPVEPTPNDTLIAFLEEYKLCPSQSELNLKNAGYSIFIAFTKDKTLVLTRNEMISQALFFNTDFKTYLEQQVLSNANDSSFEVVIWDDSFAKLEQLFIIFGGILLFAVIISICIFCFSIFCRVALVRWRTRGLSSWQVRSLPKRKYRKAKESFDTCSICLEEFKEGETVRILPCDHVFHPKCVDEWLHKWNRTCPLCKSTIKRKGGRAQNPPAQTDDNEASLLLPQEERVSLMEAERHRGRGGRYGTTGATSAHHDRSHHRGGSNSSNRSNTGHTNQLTSAEIELSVETSIGERSATPKSLYETPVHSDTDENAPSFTTAYSSTGFGSERV